MALTWPEGCDWVRPPTAQHAGESTTSIVWLPSVIKSAGKVQSSRCRSGNAYVQGALGNAALFAVRSCPPATSYTQH